MGTVDAERIQRALSQLPPSVRPLSSGLDHLGVAVSRVEHSLPLYRDLLGLPLLYEEDVPDDKVRVAVLDLGAGHLELLEPTAPDSPIARFLEKRGPGLHHVALRVGDCSIALRAAAEAGLQVIDHQPRSGAGGKQIGFLHPRSTGGLLLEFCAHP